MSTETTTTALATQPKPLPVAEFSAFGNITHFENAQRMAKALSSSAMVPETYRGEQNLGSCIIALEMANRIGANVLSVMQNLYVIHGRPAWSSQFLIGCVNASGRFSPLRYRMTGEKDKDNYGCVAWATDKTGEKLESPEITIGIAKAEGWFQKNGSKWKTMPELMLRYRCATLFARLYAPEITLGLHTEDEAIDVVEVAPVVTTPVFVPKEITPKKKEKVVDAVIVPTPPPKTETATTPPSEPIPTPAAVEPTADPRDELSFEQVVDGAPAGESPELVALRAAMTQHEVTEAQVWEFSNKKGLLRPGIEFTHTLSDIRPDKFSPLAKNILANGPTLKSIKEGA